MMKHFNVETKNKNYFEHLKDFIAEPLSSIFFFEFDSKAKIVSNLTQS